MAVPRVGPNDTVTWHAGGLTVGNVSIHHPWLWDYWPDPCPIPHRHHYTTVTALPSRNRIEDAFTVVSLLMEKGVLDAMTLKEFVKLVKDVADVL